MPRWRDSIRCSGPRTALPGALPRPEVLSAPLWIYRVLMLVWSLWLAISLLRWWRWGWECLSEGGLLRGPERRRDGVAGNK